MSVQELQDRLDELNAKRDELVREIHELAAKLRTEQFIARAEEAGIEPHLIQVLRASGIPSAETFGS